MITKDFYELCLSPCIEEPKSEVNNKTFVPELSSPVYLYCVVFICICVASSSSSCRPLARISLTLSRHFSLSFIASGRSSGIHPVSSHSCCTYVRAGRSAFARPYVGVHRSTSLMSSSLLLQQSLACTCSIQQLKKA